MTKRFITKLLTLFILCSAAFAQAADLNVDEITSEIDSVTEITEDSDVYDIENDEDYTGEEDISTKKTKKKGNFFKDLFTFGNKGKYLTLDESSCYSKNIGSQLKQYTADIVVDPATGEAGFASKSNGIYYLVFMDANARKTLKKSVDRYLNDFANKKLDRKNKKSWKLYNKFNITLRWGAIKTSTPNNGKGVVSTGYDFIGKSPYFTITIPELKNNYYDVTTAATMSSVTVKYYFTKAQITSILSMLDETKIAEAINEYNMQEYGLEEEADEY